MPSPPHATSRAAATPYALSGHCHPLLGGCGDTPARCPTAPGCHIPPCAPSQEQRGPPTAPRWHLLSPECLGGFQRRLGTWGRGSPGCRAQAGAEEPLRCWAASSQPCDCRGGSGPGSVWWGSDTGGSCSWKPSRCWGAPSQQRANARGGENRFGCCLPAQRGVIRALRPL